MQPPDIAVVPPRIVQIERDLDQALSKRRHPGDPVLELAEHQQLSDTERVAGLDAVDHEAVGLVLADVVLQERHPNRTSVKRNEKVQD